MKTAIEKNTILYWQWFGTFTAMLLVAVAIVEWALPSIDPKEATKEHLAVISFPIFGMGIYGLCMNYFPGGWYNEIQRGLMARIWNLTFLAIYVVLLIWKF